MRNVIAPAILASIMSASAFAADLPRRSAAPAPAPVFVAPVFTWTGFYVGVQGGYAWGDAETRNFIALGALNVQASPKPKGVFGGVHVGYNHQFGAMVAGVEADVNLGNVKTGLVIGRNAAGALLPPNAHSASLDSFGSVRLRLGVAAGHFMPYVTGGVAFGNAKFRFNHAGDAGRISETMIGWTVGAGIEYAFTGNWSARAEYRYTDFGNASGRVFALFPAEFQRTSLKTHAVSVGLTYRFGAPARPVVARY